MNKIIISILSSVIIVFAFSCDRGNSTCITNVSIVYELGNREVVDYNLWYSKITVHSSVENLKGITYILSDTDTILCEVDYGFSSEWECIGKKIFQLTVKNDENFDTLIQYFSENSKKFQEFSLIVKNEDSLFHILPCNKTQISYFIDKNKVDLIKDRHIIDNTVYYYY